MGGDVRVLVERLYREHGSDLEARLFRITCEPCRVTRAVAG